VPSRPFTMPHFRAWSRELILDTGKPWELEDFQEWFIRDVFRGYPEAWLIVPEGNTKTTTLGGLALYHCEFRPTAMVPVGASAREQAEWIYRQAEGFVLRSPHLQRVQDDGRPLFRCQEGYRRIRCDSMMSRIQVFAADDRTGDGVIPTLCLLDELHRHRDLRLYRTWRGKLEKRGGQLAAISTAGEPGSEFEVTRELIRQSATRTKRSRQGAFLRAESDQLVLHEWAVPENADVENLRLVKAANPFSGVTVEGLRKKRSTPTMTVAHWRRFVCNLATRAGNAAITEVEWEKAKTGERIPEGEPVWVGLDLGWKWDTTSIVPLWMPSVEHRLLGPAVVIVPPRDGTSTDPHLIEIALEDLHGVNPVHTVVMDMTNGEQLAAWIESELGARVVDRGTKNAAAVMDYAKFMEALRNGWLHHTGDQALTRQVLNAIARVLPGGETRFDRSSSSRGGRGGSDLQEVRVIDALVAAAMVNAIASSQPAAAEPWVAAW
jgi:phage terminase large subunit-like protein